MIEKLLIFEERYIRKDKKKQWSCLVYANIDVYQHLYDSAKDD